MTFQKNQNLHALKLAGALLCLTVMLGGCVDKTPVLPPKITRDLGASEKFVVTLTVGEPGVFDGIEAHANYSISNDECVPLDHSKAIGGVRLVPLEKMDLAVHKLGERKFRVEAIQQPFVPEDYYGRGVCRWAISSISFRVRKSGTFQSAVMGYSEAGDNKMQLFMCFLAPPRSGARCGDPESVGAAIKSKFFPVTIESHKE